MNYYYNVSNDDVRGVCSKLRILNAYMNYYERKGDVVYPRLLVNNKDLWKKYFVGDFDYDVYKDCIELHSDDLKEPEGLSNFMRHVKFNEHWLDKCSNLYNQIGLPKVCIYSRETDKMSEDSVLAPIFYSKLIKDKNITEPIFLLSDCEYIVKYLKDRHTNIVVLPHHRSKNFMPMHRFVNNKFNYNSMVDEEVLLDQLMIDICLICKVTTIYYGTWAGVLSMTDCLVSDQDRPTKIDIKKFNDEFISDVISYYKERETFLWGVIQDYYWQ